MDSKLISCLHLLRIKWEASSFFWERLDDCPGDDALLKLLDEAGLCHPTEKLVEVDRFRVKVL